MKTPIWKPSEEVKKRANITRFIGFVNQKYGLKIGSYDELYDWSIREIPRFWAAMWEFAPIIASRRYDEVVDDLSHFPGAKWFSGARLNFAENLLRYRDDHTALIFKGETQKSVEMSYAELYYSVRPDISSPFPSASPLGALNTEDHEGGGFLTGDGCTLYFASTRPGGVGGTDIWRARYAGD